MKDIRLTDSGDLMLQDGDLVIVSGIDQVKQHLKIRLRTFYSEWNFDSSQGVKYFEEIFVKQPNQSVVDGIIKETITQTPEVEELLEYTSVLDEPNRSISVLATVRTIYGDLSIEEVI